MLPFLLLAAVAVVAMSKKKTNGTTPAGFPETTDQGRKHKPQVTIPDLRQPLLGPDGVPLDVDQPAVVTPGSVQQAAPRSPDFAGRRHATIFAGRCPSCGYHHA